MDYIEKIRTDKGDIPLMASAIKEGTQIPGLEGVEEDVAKLKSDTERISGSVDTLETTQKEQGRVLSALWDLNEGKTYRFEEDSTTAYTKTMPSGARLTDVSMIGGKTIVWNQLFDHSRVSSVEKNGLIYTKNEDNSITVNGTATENTYLTQNINVKKDHKYLIFSTPNGGSSTTYMSYLVRTGIITSSKDTGEGAISTCLSDGNVSFVFGWINEGFTSNNLIFHPVMFDLTTMFGAGNEPTIEEFKAMFPNDYYPYTEPTLLSAQVDKVVANEVQEIPDSIKNLPGYGWSVKDVYNEVDFANKKYIQRVRVVDLGDLDYTKRDASSIINLDCFVSDNFTYPELNNESTLCGRFLASASRSNMTDLSYTKWNTTNASYFAFVDLRYENAADFKNSVKGINFAYVLSEPFVTDISDILDSMDVEGGGTLTFSNVHGDDFRIPVPNTTETVVKLSEVIA